MNAKSFGAALALIGLGAVASAQGTGQSSQGPVRLARLSYVQGDVTWRSADSSDWSRASANIPIRQGAQIWANGSGKSEVQFDDGSVMRMGLGAVATMESFYSDKDGEFTEIKVNSGTVSFHTKNQYSIYQVDTPFASVKASGATRFRVDVDKTVSVGVRLGRATVNSQSGDTDLRSGDYVSIANANDKLRVVDLPRDDAWDAYDDSREGIFSSAALHVPPNVGLVANGIDSYGNWVDDSQNGWVWYPTEGTNWQPYSDGNWIWCEPFGWTWCSNEAWGWAPYHYGSWIHGHRGWGWCPGPVNQYWCPAVVGFTSFNGDYCWTPLCPGEIRYPGAFGIGFGHGNWWMDFSIGGCCAYCPGDIGWCDPFLFDFAFGFGGGGFGDRFGGDWHQFHNDHGFIPRNSAFGAVSADAARFGQGGAFHSINHNATSMWRNGQSVMSSSRAFSGPVNARPSASSGTPSHTFTSGIQPQSLDRPMYRSSVGSEIQRTSEPFGRTTESASSRGSSDRGSRGDNGRGGDRGRGGSDVNSGGRSTESVGSSSSDPAERAREARESLGYSGRSGEAYGSSRSDSSTSGSSDRGSRGYDRSTESSGSSDRGSRGYDRSTQSSGSSDRGGRSSSSGGGRSSGGGGGSRGGGGGGDHSGGGSGGGGGGGRGR